jgi:flagellar protein FlaI
MTFLRRGSNKKDKKRNNESIRKSQKEEMIVEKSVTPVKPKSRFRLFGQKNVNQTQQSTMLEENPNKLAEQRNSWDKKPQRGFSFAIRGGNKKKSFSPPPTELIELYGYPVSAPSYEALVKHNSITYMINEPFQFVNLKQENGEITYNVIEPILTDGEKETLEIVLNAYDTLVNSDAVLVDIDDKLKFVESAFKDIIEIYNLKLTEVTYKRILYHLVRDHIGFGKIDVLVNDRFIEDISCNGSGMVECYTCEGKGAKKAVQ